MRRFLINLLKKLERLQFTVFKRSVEIRLMGKTRVLIFKDRRSSFTLVERSSLIMVYQTQ